MKIRSYIRTLFFTAVCCLFLYIPAHADSQTRDPVSVYDWAGSFRDSEIRELEAMAQKYGQRANVRYYIVTQDIFLDQSPYPYGSGIESYTKTLSEDFYDAVAAASGEKDAVILTIVMEYPNKDALRSGAYTDRYADVSGHGYCKTYLDDDRAQSVFDKIRPLLAADDLFGAAGTAIRTSYRYMKFRPGVDPSLLIFRLWFQILICLAAGGIITGSIVHRSGGRITTDERTYLDAAGSRILARRDRYLRTTVTRVKKQNDNSSSGSHRSSTGSHRSSGSHSSRASHGGGHF